MHGVSTALVLVITVAATIAPQTPVSAGETDGPFDDIKTFPIPVVWEYSNDDGKTFAKTPHEAPPAGLDPRKETRVFAYAWKGSFDLDDPARIAGLWVRIAGGKTDNSPQRASICNGDLVAASGGYWKDLGYCPTLLDAVITLNGKEVEFAHGPLLQFWVPLIGEIRKGQNTVELRGRVYTYWGGASYAGTPDAVKGLDARIVAAEAQPAAIYNGPILGDFGDGYFTLACRTQMPAVLTVEATPMEPASAAVTSTSTGKIWHRVKIEVPKGTRKVSYALSAKVGTHETKRGPYTLALPDREYRFITFGNAMQHPAGENDAWSFNCQQVLSAEPAFVLNTGNPMEQESWSFNWEKAYTGPAAELLARAPTLITPCNRDFTGIFNELHYTPASDGYSHNWTKVIGPVRFIGIDGNQTWAAGNENFKWLDGVLSEAKDKFVVVLSGYPGYSSGINSKKTYGGLGQSREVILPLLGKYKATMVLSGWDPDYERIEPTPDKGVTQIVTGSIGRAGWHKWDSRFGTHPFGPGPDANPRGTLGKVALPDGREWVGYFSMRHFCIFDVKEDAIEMRVLACGPTADTAIENLKVIDRKTFKPRN